MTGDKVDVEPIDWVVMGNNVYLESVDIEASAFTFSLRCALSARITFIFGQIGFQRAKAPATETYDSDEMGRTFQSVFAQVVLSVGQVVVFDFHGVNLRGVIKGISLLELAKHGDQRRREEPAATLGLLMDKTDLTFMKAADSAIKIKGSSKK
jgi:vesicle-fusing ATPase